MLIASPVVSAPNRIKGLSEINQVKYSNMVDCSMIKSPGDIGGEKRKFPTPFGSGLVIATSRQDKSLTALKL